MNSSRHSRTTVRPAFPAIVLAALTASAALLSAQEAAPIAWRRALGAALLAAPSAQAGSVTVIGDDRSVRTLSGAGTPLWRFDAPAKLQPFLTRSFEGNCYFGTADGGFYALNRAGRLLWRRDLGAALSQAPRLGFDGRIFVFAGAWASAFTPAGVRLWRIELPAPPVLPPILSASGGLIAVDSAGRITFLTAFGELRTVDLGSRPLALAAESPAAPVGSGGALAALADGRLVSAGDNGSLKTVTVLPGPCAGLVEGPAGIFYCLDDGRVGLIDPGSGGTAWTHETPYGGRLELQWDERGIYALSERGAAGFAVDGRRLWRLALGKTAAPPVFSDDGYVYAGGSDWILYAYKIEDRIFARPKSFFGEPNDESYGLLRAGPSEWSEDPFRLGDDVVGPLLDRVEAALAAGRIGSDETDWTASLMEMAASGESPVPRKSRDALPLSPLFRERALYLLGRFGSRELVPYLTRFAAGVKDAALKAAAIDALAAIASDPDGTALEFLAGAVALPAPIDDERIALAAARTIGALCRYSGPPRSDLGVRLLTLLAASDRPGLVRAQAVAELNSLRPE